MCLELNSIANTKFRQFGKSRNSARSRSKTVHTITSSCSVDEMNFLNFSRERKKFPSNSYLQPFLNQTHIDPIRGQDSRQIFHNMVRYHQVQTTSFISFHSLTNDRSILE